MRSFFLIAFTFLFLACSSSDSPESVRSKVDAFIANDEYERALNLLESQESSQEVRDLMEMAHLNYGMFLEYRSEDEMRSRMNGALEQFTKVLRINPNNEKAISEIEQILGVYSTIPNRQPDEKVLAELRELGFKI
jgi:tetratricopeptide (TPR) repeat protein